MDWISGMYLVMFLAGLVFVVLSFLLGGVGDTDVAGGVDADAGGLDAGGGGTDVGGHDVGQSGTVGLSPLSPLMLSMTVATFGGFGLLFKGTTDLSDGLILLITLVLTFGISALMFIGISKLFIETQATSTYSPSDAVGLIARVTTPIAKSKTGVVDYVIAGERVSSSAQSQEECKLGDTVRIRKVVGNVMFVEKEKE